MRLTGVFDQWNPATVEKSNALGEIERVSPKMYGKCRSSPPRDLFLQIIDVKRESRVTGIYKYRLSASQSSAAVTKTKSHPLISSSEACSSASRTK